MPRWVERLLVAVAVGLLLLILGLPLVAVMATALGDGAVVFWRAISHADTLAAIKLTLLATLVAVPLNAAFGVAAAWAITRFEFRGKRLLAALIALPVAVSPVVACMLFVLLFGYSGLLGPWLTDLGVRVLFTPTAVILATVFVTFPYVARELIPLMTAQGVDEELAAMVLGASGWETFFRITLPKIKWALLHGVVLAASRCLGEFGAVSVVSGHIQRRTNTVPLHIEALYDDQLFTEAFAVSSLLLFGAVLTLVVKRVIEARQHAADQPAPEAT